MMKQVGYQLIEISSNNVVDSWGGIVGQCPSIPSIVVLPNGDRILALDIDTERQGYKLIPWMMEPPPPVEPLPPPIHDISRRQFFQQASIAGLITQPEALAAVQTGTIPANLQTIIDAMTDATEKFNATMLLSGATVFERNHSLTNAIGSAMNLTSEQIDQFFIDASTL